MENARLKMKTFFENVQRKAIQVTRIYIID